MPPVVAFFNGDESGFFATLNTAAPFFASGHGAIIINNGKLFQ